jgi:aspartate kinase
MNKHTVEKIGGSSMSRSDELLDTLLIGDRKGADLYQRIFVVSAYGGITDLLLENKKSGAPGVYAYYNAEHSGSDWSDALDGVCERMIGLNAALLSTAPTAARRTISCASASRAPAIA